MKIAIVGAGGVGGYYAAVLALAGTEVTLVARGPHLAAIQKHGLRVRSLGVDLAIPDLHVTDDPSSVGPVDAIFIATKSPHLESAVPAVKALMGSGTLVIPLQNGVEGHESLLRWLPEGSVGKGLTRIISRILAPGQIDHFGAEPTILLAEGDGSTSPRVQAVVQALVNAGVKAEVPDDIDVALWQKFLLIVSTGGVSAACGAPLGVVRSQPGSRRLLESAMDEILALAQACGVALPGDSVTQALAFVDRLPAHGTGSLQRDLEAGRPSELETWTGAAVRKAKATGVPVPTHDFIYGILAPRDLRSRGELTYPTGPPMEESLAVHSDDRGFVVEPADASDMAGKANCHAVMTKPGGVRGNHYHPLGLEVMTVVGPALVRMRKDGELRDHHVEAGEARKFVFPPGVSHAVQNTGADWTLLVAFSTRAHDPARPDVMRDVLI